MSNYKKYSQEYIKQYKNDEFENVLVSIRRKQVLEALRKYKHEHILEIGCGLEPLFSYFNDYKTFTVVEPVKQFVENDRKLCGSKNKVEIVNDKIENVYRRFSSRAFDFIIMSSLLHEIPNPDAVLQATRHLCSDSTVIYIDVPNISSFHRLLGLEMGLIESLDEKSELEIRFARQNHFNKESITGLLKKNGFEIVNSFTFFMKPFSSRQMGLMLESGIIDESAIKGLEKMVKYFPEFGSSVAVEAKKANKK